MNRLWVVAYDIENDAIRRRVYQLLRDHGEAVQYSVFECWLTPHQIVQLRCLVQAEIEADDSVRWYPLCVWCRKNIDWQGMGAQSDDPPYILI